jgi:beta-glucosidase
MNASLDADERAKLLIAQMTQDEKLTLVLGYFGTDFSPKNFKTPAEARAGSAGYVPGIARLGIPPQWQTDAGIGVATQGGAVEKRERTALPSGIATAATWNPDIGYAGGKMIGAEARASGFNVMLAGGVNLLRDPRNGRNFEYGGEDPLLAGVMVGAQIAGVESNHIISTLKHFAFNDQETGRNVGNVIIDHDQARMSDLLAFEIALEKSDPGSVMCAYNRVDSEFACESQWLLTDVLRRDWGFKGYVMSDWGAVHSTAKAANSGLEQQSGFPFDDKPWFGELLRQAIAAGEVSQARLDEMVHRILRTMFAKGLFDHPVELAAIDFEAHAAVTRTDAEEGAVLLKNEGAILPLSADVKSIAVIGSHADKGVLSGGGSSQTYPVGGNAVPGLEPTGWPGPVVYYPSSPLKEIQAQAPNARVSFASGDDLQAAARLAADSEIAIVFVHQWTSEASDYALELPGNQNRLVSAVAAANPKTIVVLETGGPVFMPWIDTVPAALEAWYPGTAGGEAIANLLFGKVNPSGHLPATFPRDLSQLVRREIDGANRKAQDELFDIPYSEGATVGYKWFDAKGLKPLFPFGHGLSYTSFDYSNLAAEVRGGAVNVRFTVRNSGRRGGKDVPQVYVGYQGNGWEAPKRLAGWQKVDLQPGGSTQVSLTLDPRLFAVFRDGAWRIEAGDYRVMLGSSASDIGQSVIVRLPARTLPVTYDP